MMTLKMLRALKTFVRHGLDFLEADANTAGVPLERVLTAFRRAAQRNQAELEKLAGEDSDATEGRLAVDRESLGRLVRAVWVEWAEEQDAPKESWLLPWEQLDEEMREVDRDIGEAVAMRAQRRLARQMEIREKNQEEREAWSRNQQEEVDGIFTLLDDLKAEDETRLETLKRILKYSPYVPPVVGAEVGAEVHDWEALHPEGLEVRCRRCGIYDSPWSGEILSDSTRACIPADLDKTKTLYLTIRFDDREGRETMEARAPWDMLEDLQAISGIDAEVEWATVLAFEINARRMVRLALARMMGDRSGTLRPSKQREDG